MIFLKRYVNGATRYFSTIDVTTFDKIYPAPASGTSTSSWDGFPKLLLGKFNSVIPKPCTVTQTNRKKRTHDQIDDDDNSESDSNNGAPSSSTPKKAKLNAVGAGHRIAGHAGAPKSAAKRFVAAITETCIIM